MYYKRLQIIFLIGFPKSYKLLQIGILVLLIHPVYNTINLIWRFI